MGPGRLGLGRGKKPFTPQLPPRSGGLTPTQSSSQFRILDEEEETFHDFPPNNNRKRSHDLITDSPSGSGDGEENTEIEQVQPPTGQYPKRGPTRNVRLSNKRRIGVPLFVEFDEESQRIVGKNSQDFINELGCQLRKMASFQKSNFSKQDENLKEDIISNASQGFIYEDTPTTKRIIHMQLGTQFRTTKHNWHKHFMKFPSKEEALKNKPKYCREEDWIYLCDTFDNPDYKEMCQQNSKNRGESKSLTAVGSKSIARLYHEKKESTGEDLDPIEAFRQSRYSEKKGKMVNDNDDGTLERMLTLKATTSLTPFEICNQEVGWIPGQPRLRGKKRLSSISQQLKAEAARQKQRADEAEKKSERLAEEVSELKSKHTELKGLHLESEEKISALSSSVALLIQRSQPPEN